NLAEFFRKATKFLQHNLFAPKRVGYYATKSRPSLQVCFRQKHRII
ncbi:24119_t:CDS:2, partial [Racocetra persica]